MLEHISFASSFYPFLLSLLLNGLWFPSLYGRVCASSNLFFPLPFLSPCFHISICSQFNFFRSIQTQIAFAIFYFFVDTLLFFNKLSGTYIAIVLIFSISFSRLFVFLGIIRLVIPFLLTRPLSDRVLLNTSSLSLVRK